MATLDQKLQQESASISIYVRVSILSILFVKLANKYSNLEDGELNLTKTCNYNMNELSKPYITTIQF